MKKYILLIFISFTIIYAEHESAHNSEDWISYFSPGIQLGVNLDGTFFISIQTTIGLTVGKRIYYNDKKWQIYNYLDSQISFGLIGLGIGLINSNDKYYYKYKSWVGFWGLISYDYINWNNNKHHLGIYGVLPMRYENECKCIKID